VGSPGARGRLCASRSARLAAWSPIDFGNGPFWIFRLVKYTSEHTEQLLLAYIPLRFMRNRYQWNTKAYNTPSFD
jgi:hypothetical protein